jgi:hypothetical protein
VPDQHKVALAKASESARRGILAPTARGVNAAHPRQHLALAPIDPFARRDFALIIDEPKESSIHRIARQPQKSTPLHLSLVAWSVH